MSAGVIFVFSSFTFYYNSAKDVSPTIFRLIGDFDPFSDIFPTFLTIDHFSDLFPTSPTYLDTLLHTILTIGSVFWGVFTTIKTSSVGGVCQIRPD